jgi:hypothetical protein
LEEYFTKIEKRYYGAYDFVFTFTIGQDGAVYEHYNPRHFSKHFNNMNIDRQIISVALENIGWLKQNTSAQNIDWKGHIYNGEVVEKIWRGKNIWAVYTPQQVNALLEFLPLLIEEHNIEPNFSGNNLPMADPHKFKGLLNRSNYMKFYYDLSPAFDFELITKMLNKHKQPSQ